MREPDGEFDTAMTEKPVVDAGQGKLGALTPPSVQVGIVTVGTARIVTLNFTDSAICVMPAPAETCSA